MDLDKYADKWYLNEKEGFWFLENIVYCRKPQNPSLQCMNFYVPKAYRKSEGGWSWEGACGKYTAKTAPVVFENIIGGYAESRPADIMNCIGRVTEFTDAGMVYVSPGTRGKQTVDGNGRFNGKAPVGLVDLKCAIRFLRHNRGKFAGDTDKIISVGMSAGGAMSALLGVTGNSERYLPWLKAAGAFMEERDDVFAAQCYCPIIDLEHANMAYEWMFQGIDEYKGRFGNGTLNEFQKALSEKLSKQYVDYFNCLKLQEPETGEPLELSLDGTGGSAVEYLLLLINQAALKKQRASSLGAALEKKYAVRPVTSLREMEEGYLIRIKDCPSFDGLESMQAENQEFGDERRDFVHFDSAIGEALDELKEEFPEEYRKYRKYRHKFTDLLQDHELQERIYLLNPFNFIGKEEKTDLASHFRIRVGTKDAHTSFTMAMILALKLRKAGIQDVDYAMVWDAGHEKADYAGEFVQWIQRITKVSER